MFPGSARRGARWCLAAGIPCPVRLVRYGDRSKYDLYEAATLWLTLSRCTSGDQMACCSVGLATIEIGASVIDQVFSALRCTLARIGLAGSAVLLAALFLFAVSPNPGEAEASNPHTGTTCAQTAPFPYPSAVVGIAATPDDGGYWIVTVAVMWPPAVTPHTLVSKRL